MFAYLGVFRFMVRDFLNAFDSLSVDENAWHFYSYVDHLPQSAQVGHFDAHTRLDQRLFRKVLAHGRELGVVPSVQRRQCLQG